MERRMAKKNRQQESVACFSGPRKDAVEPLAEYRLTAPFMLEEKLKQKPDL